MGGKKRRELDVSDGALFIYKPSGMSSKDVSRHLGRSLAGKLNCGHAGTLDPMAEGVLPLLLGRASRLQDYVINQKKSYKFCMRLGCQTDSLDATGEVVLESPIKLHAMDVWQSFADRLVGSIDQLPPIYSAVKLKGRPLYEYARAGLAVDLEKHLRKVDIFSFLIEKVGEASVEATVVCSSGTYVRELARELASFSGNVMTVSYLERRMSAGVESNQCHTLEHVKSVCEKSGLEGLKNLMVPMQHLKLPLVKLVVKSDLAIKRIFHGQKVPISHFQFLDPGMDDSLVCDMICLLCAVDEEVVALVELIRQESAGETLVKIKRSLI